VVSAFVIQYGSHDAPKGQKPFIEL